MTADLVAGVAEILLVLAFPLWCAWKLAGGVRGGRWRRPGWFGRACWACAYVLTLSWIWGAAQGGLDLEETCRIGHGQAYDPGYADARAADYWRLFPLSRPCNADYDLVPAWVNPTLAVFAVLLVLSLAGLAWSTTGRSRARRTPTTTEMETRS